MTSCHVYNEVVHVMSACICYLPLSQSIEVSPDVLALPACLVGIALIVLSSHGNLYRLCLGMQAVLAASHDMSCQSHRVLLLQPPTLALPPAFDTQFKLQDGKAVTQELYDTLTAMIKQMNQAIANVSVLKDTITATAA